MDSQPQLIINYMKTIILVLLVLSFSACSIFQTSEKEEKSAKKDSDTEEVYVFDDVSEKEDNSDQIKELEKELDKSISNENKNNQQEVDIFDSPVDNTNISKTGNSFYLQLGAFSTLKRAEQYVDEVENQVPFQLSVIFNSKNSLYTVRSSAYSTKAEVQQIRENLWNRNLFKDSFIVTE